MTAPSERPAAACPSAGRILDLQDYADEVARLRVALEAYADRSRWQSVAVPLTNGNVRLCATFDGGWGVADAALADSFPCAPIRDLLAAAGFVRADPDGPDWPALASRDHWEIWHGERDGEGQAYELVFPLEGGPYYSEREFWEYERKARNFLRAFNATQETP